MTETKNKLSASDKDETATRIKRTNSGTKWSDAADKAQDELDKQGTVEEDASSSLKEHAAG